MDPAQRHDATARRGLRADAARNRAAILDAAAEVLAEQGSSVDVREIAKRSGVGMGTLYRHFPTKADLLGTVLNREFLAWADAARQAASGTADPWTALSDFFHDALDHYARRRALMERLAGDWAAPTAEFTAQLREVIEELLARVQGTMVLRPDVTADDLTLLLASLGQTVQATGCCDPQRCRRLLVISLDGLRAAADRAPLPPSDPGPQLEPVAPDEPAPSNEPAR